MKTTAGDENMEDTDIYNQEEDADSDKKKFKQGYYEEQDEIKKR
jgi:hypothetical protein